LKLIESFSNYFKRDFKKQFFAYSIVPVLLSLIFLFDFFLLPEVNETDTVSQFKVLKAGEAITGYKYITKNSFKFSTTDYKIKKNNIRLTISPIFKTVKSITVNNKNIELESGFNGISKMMLITTNFVIVFCIIYLFITKKITENARLNILFLNLLLLILWVYIMRKYHS